MGYSVSSAKHATAYESDVIDRISSDRRARREKDTRQRKQTVDQLRMQEEVRRVVHGDWPVMWCCGRRVVRRHVRPGHDAAVDTALPFRRFCRANRAVDEASSIVAIEEHPLLSRVPFRWSGRRLTTALSSATWRSPVQSGWRPVRSRHCGRRRLTDWSKAKRGLRAKWCVFTMRVTWWPVYPELVLNHDARFVAAWRAILGGNGDCRIFQTVLLAKPRLILHRKVLEVHWLLATSTQVKLDRNMDAFVEKDRVVRRELREQKLQEEADAIAQRNARLAETAAIKKMRHYNVGRETAFLMIDVVFEVRTAHSAVSYLGAPRCRVLSTELPVMTAVVRAAAHAHTSSPSVFVFPTLSPSLAHVLTTD